MELQDVLFLFPIFFSVCFLSVKDFYAMGCDALTASQAQAKRKPPRRPTCGDDGSPCGRIPACLAGAGEPGRTSAIELIEL